MLIVMCAGAVALTSARVLKRVTTKREANLMSVPEHEEEEVHDSIGRNGSRASS